jgi:hypothetical protein
MRGVGCGQCGKITHPTIDHGSAEARLPTTALTVVVVVVVVVVVRVRRSSI